MKTMDKYDTILWLLGRIDGETRKISDRVSILEQWQSRLKGGLAILAAACGYIFYGR